MARGLEVSSPARRGDIQVAARHKLGTVRAKPAPRVDEG